MIRLFRRYKELKIKDHPFNTEYEYRMFPMKIKKRIFISFSNYTNEGKIKHCHVRIWKKGKGYKKELYHVALCLDKPEFYHVDELGVLDILYYLTLLIHQHDKPEFYHVDELGVLDNKEYLESVIKLLSVKLKHSFGDDETIWNFLSNSWNLNSSNKYIKTLDKMPDYTKLYDVINQKVKK